MITIKAWELFGRYNYTPRALKLIDTVCCSYRPSLSVQGGGTVVHRTVTGTRCQILALALRFYPRAKDAPKPLMISENIIHR